MLSWSISRTDAAPTPTATARDRMIGARRSRCAADSVFGIADAGDPVAAGPHDDGRRDDRAAGRRHARPRRPRRPARDPRSRDGARGGGSGRSEPSTRSVPESNDPAGSTGSDGSARSRRRAYGGQPFVRRSRRVAALPDAVAQEVELGAPGDAVPDDLDLLDARAVDLERPLDADARRDAPDGDGPGDPATAQAHDGPLEDLDALAVALDDLGGHLHGVTGRELREVGAKLVLDDLVEHGHGAVPDSSGQPWLRCCVRRRRGRASAAEYSTASRTISRRGSRSGRRARVRSIACSRRQRATAP